MALNKKPAKIRNEIERTWGYNREAMSGYALMLRFRGRVVGSMTRHADVGYILRMETDVENRYPHRLPRVFAHVQWTDGKTTRVDTTRIYCIKAFRDSLPYHQRSIERNRDALNTKEVELKKADIDSATLLEAGQRLLPRI